MNDGVINFLTLSIDGVFFLVEKEKMNIYDLYEKVGTRILHTRGLDGEIPHIIKFFESLFLVPNEMEFNVVGDLSDYRFDKIRDGVKTLLKYKKHDRFFVYGKDWKKAMDIAVESFAFTDGITFNNGFAFFYDYKSKEINRFTNRIKYLNVTLYRFQRVMSIFLAGLTGHSSTLYIYNFSPQFVESDKEFFYQNNERIRFRQSFEGIYYLWGLVDLTIKEAYIVRQIIEFAGYEDFILKNFNEKLIKDMIINKKVGSKFYGDPFPDNKVFDKITNVMNLEEALTLSYDELATKVDFK